MTDNRQRPWKKLRVVVEVTVPPTSRATEKDLAYMLKEALPRSLALPRDKRPDTHVSTLRFKTWKAFFPIARIMHKRGTPL